jgi:hypothetical protein
MGPMARSLLPVTAIASKQAYDQKHTNPFYMFNSHFTVEHQREDVWQRQERLDPAGAVLYKQDVKADFVIGSDKRGCSYLTNHDGYLFQMAIFVYGDESEQGHPAVNHVEQMYQGRCYRSSTGRKKLGCISCHDPHVAVPPAKRPAYYRDRCLKCHQEASCTAPAADPTGASR